MTRHGERLATLENEVRHLRREADAGRLVLEECKASLSSISAQLQTVLAWQQVLSGDVRWLVRKGAIAALTVAAAYLSGVWQKLSLALAGVLGQ